MAGASGAKDWDYLYVDDDEVGIEGKRLVAVNYPHSPFRGKKLEAKHCGRKA
jgi:hypothetical protein